MQKVVNQALCVLAFVCVCGAASAAIEARVTGSVGSDWSLQIRDPAGNEAACWWIGGNWNTMAAVDFDGIQWNYYDDWRAINDGYRVGVPGVLHSVPAGTQLASVLFPGVSPYQNIPNDPSELLGWAGLGSEWAPYGSVPEPGGSSLFVSGGVVSPAALTAPVSSGLYAALSLAASVAVGILTALVCYRLYGRLAVRWWLQK